MRGLFTMVIFLMLAVKTYAGPFTVYSTTGANGMAGAVVAHGQGLDAFHYNPAGMLIYAKGVGEKQNILSATLLDISSRHLGLLEFVGSWQSIGIGFSGFGDTSIGILPFGVAIKVLEKGRVNVGIGGRIGFISYALGGKINVDAEYLCVDFGFSRKEEANLSSSREYVIKNKYERINISDEYKSTGEIIGPSFLENSFAMSVSSFFKQMVFTIEVGITEENFDEVLSKYFNDFITKRIGLEIQFWRLVLKTGYAFSQEKDGSAQVKDFSVGFNYRTKLDKDKIAWGLGLAFTFRKIDDPERSYYLIESDGSLKSIKNDIIVSFCIGVVGLKNWFKFR